MNQGKKITSIVTLLLVCLLLGGWWRYRHQMVVITKSKVDLALLEGKENIVPFLVLGSGPASLSAALYGSRSGIKTYVLRGNQPGGQLTGTSYIENWPGVDKIRGVEIMSDFEDQVSRFGSMLISDSAVAVDLTNWPFQVTTEEGHILYALSLMIGTGAAPRKLSIPGESEYWGKGVTTCAICDAPYHRGDDVVVIGGGDSAMEEALELSPYAKKVDVLIRKDKLVASVSMIEHVKKCSNVNLVFNSTLSEIKGDGKQVTSVVVKNTKTGEEQEWPSKGVFLAIGHIPNTHLFKGNLTLDDTGYLTVKPYCQMTNIEGVVAAGDVTDKRYRQAGVAAGDGIKAGLDSVWWLSSIGYNNAVQEKLEPFFFDPKATEKKKLEEINSINDYNLMSKTMPEELLVIDFFTPYCPSCMNMLPIIEWAATKLVGKVRFCKIDASIAYDLVKKFKVPDVPHMVVIKNGKILDRMKDTMSRAEFYAYIKKFLTQ